MYEIEEMSSDEIANQIGCSKSAILIKLRKSGVNLRKAGKEKARPFEDELRALYIEKKFSTRKIANTCNCSRSTVHRKLKAYGIKRRGLTESEIRYPRTEFSGDLKESKIYVDRKIRTTKDG